MRKTGPDVVTGPSKAASDDDSMRLNIGDDADHPLSSRPASIQGPVRSGDTEIGDLTKLSLDPAPEFTPDSMIDHRRPSLASNPLKRPATGGPGLSDQPTGHNGPALPRNRRAKALSGESFTPKDPDFDRNVKPVKPVKRLFDPSTDPTASNPNNRKAGKAEGPLNTRRVYDSRPQLLLSKQKTSEDFNSNKITAHSHHGIGVEKPGARTGLSAEHPPVQPRFDKVPVLDAQLDPEPQLLLQPETRPISHDQLVVEVKGIYAGLVMVEVKCIDVDEKQTQAALEKDPSRQTKLTPEQWQALIALHKTLLHEHHDFFLASQHPSATPALSRLAAKYSMPARMWRHGIHAFLEVLRHRLPHSLDYMLAFIYTAYSMMALLYETVPAFEDTWIECLGDLGRYRMAIEDDDIKDREVWSGVARFWYEKAANKSPNTGRLYHHLAILARPYTLQQLSLYTRSLTCIIPFESSKASIMTLFSPILEGKESAFYRASSMETIFIKAHALLFTGGSSLAYNECIQRLCNGVFDNYIRRVTAKFKEQGVFAALSNISSLFEYGALAVDGTSRSTLWLAFEESRSRKEAAKASQRPENVENAPSPPSRPAKAVPLSPKERDKSLRSIARASELAFGTLRIALLRLGDKNVYPMIHVYLVFIYSMLDIDDAMHIFEQHVPWVEIVDFLNSMIKLSAEPDMSPSRVFAKPFPTPHDGVGRPLPEDFVMRGQPWTELFFPHTWFSDASIDDEERTLELPSFTAPRGQRMVWLGLRIADLKKWLLYNIESRTFEVSQQVKDSLKRAILEVRQVSAPSTDQDSLMTGLDDEEDESFDFSDSPPRSDHFRNVTRSEPEPPLATNIVMAPTWKGSSIKPLPVAPTRILTKGDVKMTDSTSGKQDKGDGSPRRLVNTNSEEWLKSRGATLGPSPRKGHGDYYASDPVKVDILNPLDGDANDPTKV